MTPTTFHSLVEPIPSAEKSLSLPWGLSSHNSISGSSSSAPTRVGGRTHAEQEEEDSLAAACCSDLSPSSLGPRPLSVLDPSPEYALSLSTSAFSMSSSCWTWERNLHTSIVMTKYSKTRPKSDVATRVHLLIFGVKNEGSRRKIYNYASQEHNPQLLNAATAPVKT